MILSLLRLPLAVVNSVRQLVSQTFFVAVLFSVITWTSILLYGVFYWNYIPKSSHVYPVHLHFESRACPAGFCDFLMANVTIVRLGQDDYLARGQRYKIYLDLEMPESEANQRIGMFTVGLDMISEDGEVLKSTHRSTKPATQAGLVIRNSHIEVYTATLKIYADFTGLRYLLYNWPLTSAVVGISTNFFFVSLVALLSWNHLTPTAKPKPHRRSSADRKEGAEKDKPEDDADETEDDTSSDASSGQPDIVKETKDAKIRKRKELDEKTGKTLRQLFGATSHESSTSLSSLGGGQEASGNTRQRTST
ncbi:seipin isoform X2 [Rhipicephalus sanguineus]|uniref:seipin isoform X2 n=1 Tax=Rhipicephalus sanguineus TaxID=34632 RepID=UPI001894178E|nr:seipin isoform X2 [Rhipicephalus sanguineus]